MTVFFLYIEFNERQYLLNFHTNMCTYIKKINNIDDKPILYLHILRLYFCNIYKSVELMVVMYFIRNILHIIYVNKK